MDRTNTFRAVGETIGAYVTRWLHDREDQAAIDAHDRHLEEQLAAAAAALDAADLEAVRQALTVLPLMATRGLVDPGRAVVAEATRATTEVASRDLEEQHALEVAYAGGTDQLPWPPPADTDWTTLRIRCLHHIEANRDRLGDLLHVDGFAGGTFEDALLLRLASFLQTWQVNRAEALRDHDAEPLRRFLDLP